MESNPQRTDNSSEPLGTGRSGDEPRPGSGAPGLVLGGKYQLISEIGRGGMGSVWRAERLDWRALVAVKLMHVAGNSRARARFEREVRLAASLRSPHVVQVLDHGIDEGTGNPFIAMELLEGESLAARLRRLRTLPPGEVMTIVTHVGRALTRAHESGVVHRDLKPDNIYLVSNEDEPIAKILDFGVAKWLDVDELDGRPLTRPGRALGTPFYMSPEQFRGKKLDHRLDLWSLAAIACECLTGKRPFGASDLPSLALLLCTDSPRPVPSALGPVPVGFDEWFAKATAPSIDDRFQSAQDLVDALRAICGGPIRMAPLVIARDVHLPNLPTMAPLTRTSEGRSMLRRRPVLAAILLAAILVGSTINVLAYRHWSASRGRAPEVLEASVSAALPPAAPAVSPPGPSAPSEPPPSSAPAPEQELSAEEPLPAPEPPPSAETTVAARATIAPRPRAPSNGGRRSKSSRPRPTQITQPTAGEPERAVTIDDDRIIRTSL